MIASPVGVFVLLPLFACGVGIVMAWQGQLALHTVLDTIVLDNFFTQSTQASRRTQRILGQALALSTRWQRFLKKHKGAPPRELMAQTLVDLMSEREGIAWMSYGRDDGKFWGVFRNLEGDYIFTQRIVQPGGYNDLKDYKVTAKGLVLLRHRPRYSYDHRKRSWYKFGKRQKGPAWTKPYTFYVTGIAGISCVEPLVIGKMAGVTTVDYSLNSLSKFVERLNASRQGSAFLFTKDQVLLAYPGSRHDMMGHYAHGKAGLPKANQHPNKLLRAFFKTPEVLNIKGKKPKQFEFLYEKKRIFANITPSPIDEHLTWYVGAFIPRAKLVAPVKQHRQDAIEIALLTLLISLQLGGLISWQIWRSREALRKANDATQRAVAATQKAEEEAYALGSYTLLRLIGGGGMGEVWEARHQMLARPAAIKLIRGDILTSKQNDPALILKHFEREAKATARLTSPHTVRLFDYGTSDEGHFFYVMELLRGLDLRQLVLKQGPQRVGRVVHVMRQVSLSLAEAHKNGLVHRDLKPANIFLCALGTQLDFVKVLDFGVVHIDNDTETNQTAIGTPSIMAPEQIKGETQLDGRSDLYALGCLAHWMLTGENVFGKDSVTNVLAKHLKQPAPSVRLKCPFPVPDELDELILGCLSKDREHRPANAETLMRMLDNIPIPVEQAWDAEAIQTWWSTHFPALQAVGWHAHALEERLITTPIPAEHPTLRTPSPHPSMFFPSDTKRLYVAPSEFQPARLPPKPTLPSFDSPPQPFDAAHHEDDSLITQAEKGITIQTLHKTAFLKKQ